MPVFRTVDPVTRFTRFRVRPASLPSNHCFYPHKTCLKYPENPRSVDVNFPWKCPSGISQPWGLSLPGRRVSGKAPVPIFITHLGREVNLGCCEIFCHGRICLIVYNKNKHTHDSNMIIIPSYFLGVPKVATDICGILWVSHFQGQVVG